jgi:hypothetical protein
VSDADKVVDAPTAAEVPAISTPHDDMDKEVAGEARSDGRQNGAAILESLAKITESGTHYVPSLPIMKGERTD